MPPPAKPPRPWINRVFHSTYTRGGRRIALNGWSVRIQHEGRRRTFSLAAETRAGAAAEAQAIYEQVTAGGWETVVRHYSGGRLGRAFPKADPRWWREHLVLRSYPLPEKPGPEQEFSIHIEHAGMGWYFPLGTGDSNIAAINALKIYRVIIDKGWAAAFKRFPREVTVGFHWDSDPLLWTYTTIHTAPPIQSAAKESVTGKRILLVEKDEGVRNALAYWITRHAGLRCVACSSQNEAFRDTNSSSAALYLINRDSADAIGFSNPDQVSQLADGVPAAAYTLHKDSQELFALTPGGASGYLLKRTAPGRMLEPIEAAISRAPVHAEKVLRSTHTYFQRLLHSSPARKEAGKAAQLTQREQDVLNLMSKGSADKEIALILGISTWTVHEHVKKIFEKLQVHSRTELLLTYFQK